MCKLHQLIDLAKFRGCIFEDGTLLATSRSIHTVCFARPTLNGAPIRANPQAQPAANHGHIMYVINFFLKIWRLKCGGFSRKFRYIFSRQYSPNILSRHISTRHTI